MASTESQLDSQKFEDWEAPVLTNLNDVSLNGQLNDHKKHVLSILGHEGARVSGVGDKNGGGASNASLHEALSLASRGVPVDLITVGDPQPSSGSVRMHYVKLPDGLSNDGKIEPLTTDPTIASVINAVDQDKYVVVYPQYYVAYKAAQKAVRRHDDIKGKVVSISRPHSVHHRLAEKVGLENGVSSIRKSIEDEMFSEGTVFSTQYEAEITAELLAPQYKIPEKELLRRYHHVPLAAGEEFNPGKRKELALLHLQRILSKVPEEQRQRMNITEKTVKFATVGRMVAYRRVAMMVKEFYHFLQSHPQADAAFFIFGESDDKPINKEQINQIQNLLTESLPNGKLLRDYVVLAGQMDHKDVYAGYDVYAGAIPFETFGLAPTEAARGGAAIVLTENGVNKEIFGEGDVLVPDRKVSGLNDGPIYIKPDQTELYRQAFEAAYSLEQWRRASGDALSKRIREQYSWQRNGEMLEQAMDKVIFDAKKTDKTY